MLCALCAILRELCVTILLNVALHPKCAILRLRSVLAATLFNAAMKNRTMKRAWQGTMIEAVKEDLKNHLHAAFLHRP